MKIHLLITQNMVMYFSDNGKNKLDEKANEKLAEKIYILCYIPLPLHQPFYFHDSIIALNSLEINHLFQNDNLANFIFYVFYFVQFTDFSRTKS